MATLAGVLDRARREIDHRWPARDRRSDGWIGDAAHQRVISDHNPNARGVVDAIDVDVDGIHRPTVVAAFLMLPATHYVISNRRIYAREVSFRPVTYTGTNPHTDHIHESIMQSPSAEQSSAVLDLSAGQMWSTLRVNARGTAVEELQAILNAQGAALAIDGDFGPLTLAAVRAFQVRYRVANSVTFGVGDGIVGPATRASLFTV